MRLVHSKPEKMSKGHNILVTTLGAVANFEWTSRAYSSVSQKQNSSCPIIVGMFVQPDSPEARGKQPRLPKYFD